MPTRLVGAGNRPLAQILQRAQQPGLEALKRQLSPGRDTESTTKIWTGIFFDSSLSPS